MQSSAAPLQGSIIVPVLNEAESIDFFLADLLATATDDHWEILVVDGGSQDGTLQKLSRFPVKVIRSLPGRARQMNEGAACARGHILLFLHADTRLPGDWWRQLHYFAESSFQWGRFDVRLQPGSPLLRVVQGMMNLRSRITGIATGDQAIFIRRTLFESLQGFADIPLMEDVEICKRLKSIGQPCCIASQAVTSSRRWQKKGVVKTIALMWGIRFAYWLGVPPHRLWNWYNGGTK